MLVNFVSYLLTLLVHVVLVSHLSAEVEYTPVFDYMTLVGPSYVSFYSHALVVCCAVQVLTCGLC